MPNIITASTIAVLFSSLFAYPMGPVNSLFQMLGWSDSPIFFLQDKTTARGIVSFIQFWMWYGNTMIILIAGVMGINPALFESAAIDGASGTQTFFRITLPSLRTILLLHVDYIDDRRFANVRYSAVVPYAGGPDRCHDYHVHVHLWASVQGQLLVQSRCSSEHDHVRDRSGIVWTSCST